MAAENVSAQEAVNRLVGIHETSAKRISKLESQLDELLKKFSEIGDQNANPVTTEIQTIPNETLNVESSNASKIIKLEGQIDEVLRSFQDYREQNTNPSRDEFQTMSDRVESIQALTASYFDETTSKHEESKKQWSRMYADINNNMNCILNKLDSITGSKVTSSNTDINLGRPMPTTTYPVMSRSGHPFQTDPLPIQTEIRQEATVQNTFPLNGVKHSIIVPPASAAPEFYGKQSESPTQFLIRVLEYAESVHAWDRATLLNGISQFLRDSALE